MCGRYALALRPSEVRQQLEQSQMPVDGGAPDDDSVRQSYNFAPGYHGLIYRADGPEHGKSESEDQQDRPIQEQGNRLCSASVPAAGHVDDTKYRLQAMKWGLVPFWTKRNPDYGSMLKTINCRDDSLYEDRGMWTSMKKKKRCIVVAQGFYEWLKKNNGKEKMPHFTKRKDGQLMCLAGLYDCVQFDDSAEKLYTYTIITTDSNKQLKFLHDRMPVILDNGSEDIKTWLDPNRTEWSTDLQTLLRPYEGELECYPVSKDVGKVGNNSAQFVVPIDSRANKSNIANFFGNQRKLAKTQRDGGTVGTAVHDDEGGSATNNGEIVGEDEANEGGACGFQAEGSEDKAGLAIADSEARRPSRDEGFKFQGIKRERGQVGDDGDTADGGPQQKRRALATGGQKSGTRAGAKKVHRSATSNGSGGKTGGGGQQRIESFFR